jgi:hypothetical protein
VGIRRNVCPYCSKIFPQPLITLNLEDGKLIMVNACPGYNESLEDKQNKEPNIGFIVEEPE